MTASGPPGASENGHNENRALFKDGKCATWIDATSAAWSMAFVPAKHTKNVLMWMLSAKMLPPVGVIIPIYLLFRDLGLLDTRLGLIIVLMLINLPIIIWMLYTYFKEIPGEILEAARMDGSSLPNEVIYVLAPMAVPGIASTVLFEHHSGLE